jgi:hypothetical protein
VSRDGFATADVDTGLMADPKVVALARRLRDPAPTMAAVGLYQAVVLASWHAGERVTLEDAVPGWYLDSVDGFADHLVTVGLLDAEHRVPEHAWEGWYGTARDRRQYYRDLGSKGGKAAHGLPPPSARSSVRSSPSGRQAGPSFLPTGSPSPDAAFPDGAAPVNGSDDIAGSMEDLRTIVASLPVRPPKDGAA